MQKRCSHGQDGCKGWKQMIIAKDDCIQAYEKQLPLVRMQTVGRIAAKL